MPVTPDALAAQSNDASFPDIWSELKWRGLIHVSTNEDELQALLSGDPITFYSGFDPTAASLHLGNLVQLITMRRLQLAGHRPLGLVGGSTGLIGDPRPTSERQLNTRETVAGWADSLKAQVGAFLSFDGDNAARIVNNLDWTAPMSAIDFLREIGKHYRVGTMLKKDAVATRLNSDEGISYTEFSYQILQGLDFRQLYLDYGCVLQTGGSDQWGNLTSGVDLIKRSEGVSVHAIGTPLITTSDGKKFGKSEGNAVWLDATMTSPYAMYQFWLNTDDADVISHIKTFTFLARAEIEELAESVANEPFKRAAQKVLAAEVTGLVHGAEAVATSIAAADALFGQGDLEALDAATIESALSGVAVVDAGPESSISSLLVETGLVASLGEARRAITQGGVYLNNVKVKSDAQTIAGSSLAGGFAILRRGKKTLAGIRNTSASVTSP
jgi:tyrosyl-tRNA synthetase